MDQNQSKVNQADFTIENLNSMSETDERLLTSSEIKEEDLSQEVFYFTASDLNFDGAGQSYEVLNTMVDNSAISFSDSSFSIPFSDDQMNQLLLDNGSLNHQDDGKTTVELNNLLKMNVPELKEEMESAPLPIPHVKFKHEANGKSVKIWECGICHKEFGHQYILMRHLPTHTDERKFQCKQCGKAFRQMSTLSQHKAIHSKLRPYVCEVCHKTFNRVSTLISHRKTHTGMKPHRCHLCSKAFHQKGNLRNHIFTHTNERPYKCDVCQKGFNQMSNLMCHKFKAHQRADKPKYICPTCGKEFEKRIGLRNHEQYEHGDINIGNATTSKSSNQRLCAPSVKYTNGVLVSQINTSAMRYAKAINQVPFALLKPIDGIPVLVRVLPAGDKQMLVPATAEDLKKYGQITVKDKPTDKEKSKKSKDYRNTTVLIRIPVVASVIQRRRSGVVHMDIESPGPHREHRDGGASDTDGSDSECEIVDMRDKENIQPNSIRLDMQEVLAPPADFEEEIPPGVIDVDGSSVQIFDAQELDVNISNNIIELTETTESDMQEESLFELQTNKTGFQIDRMIELNEASKIAEIHHEEEVEEINICIE